MLFAKVGVFCYSLCFYSALFFKRAGQIGFQKVGFEKCLSKSVLFVALFCPFFHSEFFRKNFFAKSYTLGGKFDEFVVRYKFHALFQTERSGGNKF